MLTRSDPTIRQPGRATPAPSVRSGARSAKPSLRVERALLRAGHSLVAGMDEVGRGALAGPVTVGVVVVHAETRSAPVGLRDSKLLAPAVRARLAPKVRRWAPGWAVGHAEAIEVDAYGVIAALRLAGTRALVQLNVLPDVIVLDGNHDWLTPPPPALIELTDLTGRAEAPLPSLNGLLPKVQTMIKADLRCTAVAAASVLAKTTRDAIMVDLARANPQFDRYAWAENKGYSAPDHMAALIEQGPTPHHRRTWRLPGIMGNDRGDDASREEDTSMGGHV